MPKMQVPTTDAFNEMDQFESLTVELTADQVEWLEETAAERGVSVDHMLRSIIAARMEENVDIPTAPSGDGAAHAAPADVTEGTSSDASRTPALDENREADSPSIIESLRSASERLQDLTEDEEDANPNLRDTLTRLQSYRHSAAEQDPSSESDAEAGKMVMDQSQSMFDMMEE